MVSAARLLCKMSSKERKEAGVQALYGNLLSALCDRALLQWGGNYPRMASKCLLELPILCTTTTIEEHDSTHLGAIPVPRPQRTTGKPRKGKDTLYYSIAEMIKKLPVKYAKTWKDDYLPDVRSSVRAVSLC